MEQKNQINKLPSTVLVTLFFPLVDYYPNIKILLILLYM